MTARIRVRVRPGARRERVAGFREDGALKLDVTAPPEGGRANQAVVALLAEALGVSRSRVTVTRGMTSRDKSVAVEDLTEDEVRKRLEEAAKQHGDGDGR